MHCARQPRGWIRSFQSTASSPEKDRHRHTRGQRVPHGAEVDSSTDPDSSQGCRMSSLVHMAGVHTEIRQGGRGVRRGSGPVPAGVGRTLDGLCKHSLNVQLVSQTRVLAPKGPWVGDGWSSPVLALWGCCNKTPQTRRLVGKTLISQGLEAGSPSSCSCRPRLWRGLTLRRQSSCCASRVCRCLSGNRGTDLDHKGLILMTSSPRAPPPVTVPHPGDAGFTT